MRIFKLLLLLLAVILVDVHTLCIKAYAGDIPVNEMQFSKVESSLSDRASSPKCVVTEVAARAASTALAASVAGLIFAVVVSSSVPSMAWLVGASTAGIVLTVTENMMFFACKYSFVRHPVLRFKDGTYKTCTNPKLIRLSDAPNAETLEVCPDHQFSAEKNYIWPKNKAPYGDYIEFCNRPVLGGLCIGGDCISKLDPRERETSPEVLESKSKIGGSLTCKVLKDNEQVKLGGVLFKASYKGDKICVDAWGIGDVAWWPKPEIGCHLREPMPPSPMCSSSVAIKDSDNKIRSYDNSACFNCYISPACYSESGAFAHSPLAMTSVVVQCLKESLSAILSGCGNEASKSGFLDTAKNHLKNTVKALIVLALMLFGMKLMLGAVQNMSEIGILIIKICLVFYFSIGDGMNLYYKNLVSISTGLSDMVLRAGGNPTVCNYKTDDYKFPVVLKNTSLDTVEKRIYREIIQANIYHSFAAIRADQQNFPTARNITEQQFDSFLSKLEIKDYSYLAVWDRLDCRITFYLGQSVNQGVGFTLLSLLIMPLAFLFVGQIILTISILFFVMMLLIMCLWIVHLFVISLIAITIISLFAPLFVPMCLFQVTKTFFDGWLKELVAYSLYPVVLFSLMGIIFSVFDVLYFGDLTFKPVRSMNYSSIRAIYNFTLDPDNQCDGRTNNLACIVTKSNFITRPLIFGINVTAVDVWGDTDSIWKGFAMMALMAFLFYHFLGIVGSFAAELVGSFRADFSRSFMSASDIGQKAIVGAISLGSGIKNRASEVGNNLSTGNEKSTRKRPREGISSRVK